MAGEHCRASSCGSCGRCDAEPDTPDYFYCLWCNEPALDDYYWPYCCSICALYAERDSMEDGE
jgi:hypothetical protein